MRQNLKGSVLSQAIRILSIVMIFQDQHNTLEDKGVNAVGDRVVDTLKIELNAKLRN